MTDCQIQVHAPSPFYGGQIGILLGLSPTRPCGAPATHVLGLIAVCEHIPTRRRLEVCERHALFLAEQLPCDDCRRRIPATEAVTS